MSAVAATWQRGFDLEELKDRARPFRADFKKYSLGQFSVPKESDIAAALSQGKCLTATNALGTCAAILFSQLKRPSAITDFAARSIPMEPGDLMVSKVAFHKGSEEAAAVLIGQLRQRSAVLWLQIYEEWPEAREMVQSLGLQYVATKVSAASEVIGLYASGLPASRLRSLPALHDAEQPAVACLNPLWLSEDEHEVIISELDRFRPIWADHYSSYNKRHSWSAFALRGYDTDPNFIEKPAEMSREWKAKNAERLSARPMETSAAIHFPATLACVNRLPGLKDRVRFMRLAARKGELTRHADITDREAGVADGRVARLHIPIFTNPSVTFCNWDARGRIHRTHMKERSLYYLDQRKPHTAANAGSFDRLHLVVDVLSSDWIRDGIVGSR